MKKTISLLLLLGATYTSSYADSYFTLLNGSGQSICILLQSGVYPLHKPDIAAIQCDSSLGNCAKFDGYRADDQSVIDVYVATIHDTATSCAGKQIAHFKVDTQWVPFSYHHYCKEVSTPSPKDFSVDCSHNGYHYNFKILTTAQTKI